MIIVRDVVLTSFFTGRIDPQRGRHLDADKSLLQPLVDSCGEKLVVLHDCFDNLPCENYRVDAPEVAYRQRWASQLDWLGRNPDVRAVWLVDATDVRMLREPWTHMQPGTLYCGWETCTVGIDWIRDNSPAVIDWVDGHADEGLLNCGVVGGERGVVMDLCRRMNRLWRETGAEPLHEMAFFNIAAREMSAVTGPQVTTEFKRYQDNGVAWWMHK